MQIGFLGGKMMNRSERMDFIFAESRKKAEAKPEDHFGYDLYRFALEKYADLEAWEKSARAMADAIRNQEVLIEPYDRLIGRSYYGYPRAVEAIDRDILYKYSLSSTRHGFVPRELCPEYQTLLRYQLVSAYTPGHVAWNWHTVLANGTEGLRRRCQRGLQRKAELRYAPPIFHPRDALSSLSEKHRLKRLWIYMRSRRRLSKTPITTRWRQAFR